MVKIHASTLPIKQKEIEKTIKKVEKHIDAFHCDIIDGKFTKNKKNTKITQKITKHTKKPLSIHLMVKNPEKYIEKTTNQIKEICFHYEATKKHNQIIKKIQKHKKRVGIAINPQTDIDKVQKYLKKIDYILIMSVNPGKSGQKYKKNTEKKVEKLKQQIKRKKYKTKIYVDGGINPENSKNLIKKGANVLITGNYLLKSKEKMQNKIKKLKNK